MKNACKYLRLSGQDGEEGHMKKKKLTQFSSSSSSSSGERVSECERVS